MKIPSLILIFLLLSASLYAHGVPQADIQAMLDGEMLNIYGLELTIRGNNHEKTFNLSITVAIDFYYTTRSQKQYQS